MNRTSFPIFTLPLLALGLLLPAAQAQTANTADVPVVTVKAPPARLSPHETINLRIPGGRVIIVYGRPYTAKPKSGEIRSVWGGELVPTGKIWRLGSDEATLLITPKALVIGSKESSVSIPAGVYTLFLNPESMDNVQLVISKQFGEWGLEYDSAQDLGRVAMKKARLSEPIHQFQMGLDRAPGGGVIKLMWEDTQFSVPFTVAK